MAISLPRRHSRRWLHRTRVSTLLLSSAGSCPEQTNYCCDDPSQVLMMCSCLARSVKLCCLCLPTSTETQGGPGDRQNGAYFKCNLEAASEAAQKALLPPLPRQPPFCARTATEHRIKQQHRAHCHVRLSLLIERAAARRSCSFLSQSHWIQKVCGERKNASCFSIGKDIS